MLPVMEFDQQLVDLVGGQHLPAGGIDLQQHGLHPVVVGGLLQLILDVRDQGRAIVVDRFSGDHAGQLDDRDLVAGIAVLQHDFVKMGAMPGSGGREAFESGTTGQGEEDQHRHDAEDACQTDDQEGPEPTFASPTRGGAGAGGAAVRRARRRSHRRQLGRRQRVRSFRGGRSRNRRRGCDGRMTRRSGRSALHRGHPDEKPFGSRALGRKTGERGNRACVGAGWRGRRRLAAAGLRFRGVGSSRIHSRS